MRVIYKYPLEFTHFDSHITVQMPEGAEVIKVHHQFGNPVQLWAIVNPEHPLEDRRFYLAMTGSPLPMDIDDNADMNVWYEYCGTAVLEDKSFGPNGEVCHIFEARDVSGLDEIALPKTDV